MICGVWAFKIYLLNKNRPTQKTEPLHTHVWINFFLYTTFLFFNEKKIKIMPSTTTTRKQHFHCLNVFTQYVLHNVVPIRGLHGGHGAVETALAECYRLGVCVLRVLEEKIIYGN